MDQKDETILECVEEDEHHSGHHVGVQAVDDGHRGRGVVRRHRNDNAHQLVAHQAVMSEEVLQCSCMLPVVDAQIGGQARPRSMRFDCQQASAVAEAVVTHERGEHHERGPQRLDVAKQLYARKQYEYLDDHEDKLKASRLRVLQ